MRVREKDRCIRCGMGAPNGHWHHRRSRSIRDLHQHCPCNGVWLCRTCHEWVHANPFLARGDGLIVSRYAIPLDMPVVTPWGRRLHDCEGKFSIIQEER